MSYRLLQARDIISTAERLQLRIEERFPNSGLSRVARDVIAVAEEAKARAEAASRPIWWLRVAIGVLIFGLLLVFVVLARKLPIVATEFSLPDLLQGVEAAINEIIFLCIGVYFLCSLEARLKRSRALVALHEIRSLVHVVDMHQLTKDPARFLSTAYHTLSSPKAEFTGYQLSRYLDYCSELLSLLAKVAALYAQYFNDAIVLDTVTEIEGLSAAMSTKIWQKILLANSSQQ